VGVMLIKSDKTWNKPSLLIIIDFPKYTLDTEYCGFFYVQRGISCGDGFEKVKIGAESYFRDGAFE
jgi:hypothetical protein